MKDHDQTKNQRTRELITLRQRVAELEASETKCRDAEEALQRSEAEARRLAQENTVMAEVGRIISSTLKIEEVYDRFAEEVRNLISCDLININMINEEGYTVTTAYSAGTVIPGREIGSVFPLTGSVTEEIIRTRSGLIVQPMDRLELEDRHPGFLCPFEAGHRSMIMAPLISKDQVIGTLYLGSSRPRAYTDRDLKLAEHIGAQIAGAIANAHLFTRRMQVEEALQESEARYKRLIDSVTDYIYTVQIEEGRPVATFHGPGCLAVTGYTPDEYLADPYLWYRIVYVEDRGAVTEQAARVSAGETTTRLEHRIVHRNGSIRWVRNTSVPHYDEHRRLVAYDGLITDITERKEAETAAKRIAHEDSVLAEIGRIISSTLNIEEVYKAFAERVTELIGFDRVAIGLINTDEGTMSFPYTEGLFVPGREPGDVGPLAGSTAEKILQTHAGMIIAMESEEDIVSRIPALLPDFRCGIRSALTVPLISGDRVIGTLALRSTIPGIYTELDLKLVQSIANEIAGAIANAQLYGRLKETEESLRRSEGTFRELYDSAPVGYHEFDMEGRITNVNQRDQEMLGYSREELIGKHVWKFTVEEDIAHREILEKLAGFRPPGRSFGRTYRRKDGMTFPVLLQDRLNRDDQGRITGMRVAVQDVTEQKRTEEALRQSKARYDELVQRIPVGVYTLRICTDGSMVFEYVSPQLCQVLGLDADTLMRDANQAFAIAHPEDRDNLIRTTREAGVSLKAFRWEGRFVIRNETRWVRIESNPTPLLRGESLWNGVLSDVTEQKKASQEVELLQEQLHQAQKMEAIGTLAGGIAHDFNNILSAILGYAELASFDIKENSRIKHNLEQSMKAAYRAKDLVQQILAFSRQGKQERKLMNIKPIIKEGLKFLRASLPATVEIRQNIRKDLGTIEADPTQVHQVLMNLCANAAHAMSEKGGVLEVSLSNFDLDGGSTVAFGGMDPGAYVRLRVSDTGHGMPPEILKRIFDPYFTTKEPGKGTGLGLAVVHGIVKSYGGGITISSEVGKGSTFDIYFPRIGIVNLPSETDKVEPLPLGEHERVLFVDDERAIAEVVREVLEYLGYEVVMRTSSIEALELFRVQADRFDLVITDMTMPNMRGDKLAQEFLRIRPEIPIILCTGFSEHITEEKAKAMGIRALVMKPFVMKELAKVIRRTLDAPGLS